MGSKYYNSILIKELILYSVIIVMYKASSYKVKQNSYEKINTSNEDSLLCLSIQ